MVAVKIGQYGVSLWGNMWIFDHIELKLLKLDFIQVEMGLIRDKRWHTNWMMVMGWIRSYHRANSCSWTKQHSYSQRMRSNRPCWLIGVMGSPPTWVMLLDLLGVYVINTQVGGETITYQSGRWTYQFMNYFQPQTSFIKAVFFRYIKVCNRVWLSSTTPGRKNTADLDMSHPPAEIQWYSQFWMVKLG